MTKSKTSTIAIVVLSVLLAAALASTIVLAAFTFSRSATTTITFSGGITVSVTGISGTDPYAWNSTVGSASKQTASVEVTGAESVSFDAISATVAGQAAYVAIKAEIAKTGNGTATAPAVDYSDSVIDATGVDGLTTKTGWYIVGTDTTASLVQTGNATTLVDSTTVYTYGTDTATAFDGAIFTGTVKIVAAISIAELATLMV